jgi:hypothetical protein
MFSEKITVNYTTSQLTKGTSQLEKVRHEYWKLREKRYIYYFVEKIVSQILILFFFSELHRYFF